MTDVRIRFKLLSRVLPALLVLTSFAASVAKADDAQTKIIASVTVADNDSLWNAAEKIAAEMKYDAAVRSAKSVFSANNKLFAALDPAKQKGIVVFTNGTDIVPFAYLPVTPDSLDEAAINELKEQLNDKTDGKFDELFLKDSTVYVCNSKFKDAVTSLDEGYKTTAAQDGKTTLVAVDVALNNIPDQFIEAGLANVRQKIAESLSDADAEATETVASLLDFYSTLIDSIENVKFAVCVDSEANVTVNASVKSVSGSELEDIINGSANLTTRWTSFAETNNLALFSVKAQKQIKALNDIRAKQIHNAMHENLLNSLDVQLDSPEDLDVAKQVVQIIEDEALASLELDVVDCGFALGIDPFILKTAGSVAKPDDVKKGLQLVAERIKKDVEDFDKYASVNAEEKEGFSVTKVNVPISDISDDAPDFLAGKSLSARIGIDSESFVFFFGLDGETLDAEFAKTLAGSKEKKPVPAESFLDLVPIAKGAYQILSQIDDVNPPALDSVEAAANAGTIKFVCKEECKDGAVDVDFVIDHNFFKTAGEILRINVTGGSTEDNSEDVDDLFEE